MQENILIVEDEKELANILGSYLEVEGYQVHIAFDGEEGLSIYSEGGISLVLLDIMLPKKSGIEVCKEIRAQSDIPIIILSARDGEMDKVIALGVGADDYVTKPYSPLELVARVKAQLRRYHSTETKERPEDNGLVREGDIKINRMTYEVWIGDQQVQMTTKEFEVLAYMMENKSQVLTKEQIYQGVWGDYLVMDENTVAVYINRIRDKCKKYSCDCIKTVWGVGYRFVS